MIKITKKKIYLLIFYLFSISLFLLKLPPFNLISFIPKTGTTHVLAKLVILLICGAFLLLDLSLIKALLRKMWVFVFLFLYFIASSLSIIEAVDIPYFFQQYQNVALGIAIFCVSIILTQKIRLKYIFNYVVIVGLIIIVADLLFALFPTAVLTVLSSSLQEEMSSLYGYNLTQQKYNLYLCGEAFLPFIFFFTPPFSLHIHGGKKIFTYIFSTLMGFLSMYSNFRTRLIQFVFSFALSIYCASRGLRQNIILVLALIIFSTAISFYIIRNNTQYDIVDRFIMSNDEDMISIEYRFDTFTQAFSVFKINPITGVGLGNYKLYVNRTKTSRIADRLIRIHAEETNDNPHSVFVQIITETGLVGLSAFIALLLFFLKSDFHIFVSPLFSKNTFLFSCIIASWTVFLYGLFNPFNTVFLNGWFWYFRGLVEGVAYTIRSEI